MYEAGALYASMSGLAARFMESFQKKKTWHYFSFQLFYQGLNG
jgi:hypothetical protein